MPFDYVTFEWSLIDFKWYLHYRKRFPNSKNDLIFATNLLKIVLQCRKKDLNIVLDIFFQSMSKGFPSLAQYEAILPKFGKNAVKVQKLAWLCQILNYQHQNLVNENVPTK